MGICIASMIGAGIFTVTGTIGFELVTVSNLRSADRRRTRRPAAASRWPSCRDAPAGECPVRGRPRSPGRRWVPQGHDHTLIGYVLARRGGDGRGRVRRERLPSVEPRLLATVLLLGLGLVHATTVIGGQRFNDLLVAFKVALIAAFIVFGFLLMGDPLVPSPEVLGSPEPRARPALGTVLPPNDAEIVAHRGRRTSAVLRPDRTRGGQHQLRLPGLGHRRRGGGRSDDRRNLLLAILGSVLLVGGSSPRQPRLRRRGSPGRDGRVGTTARQVDAIDAVVHPPPR